MVNKKKELIKESNINVVTEMYDYEQNLEGVYIIKSYQEFQSLFVNKKINLQSYMKYNESFFDKHDIVIYIHPSTDIIQYEYIKQNILKIIYSCSSIHLSTEMNFIEVEKNKVKNVELIYSGDISWWNI